MNDHCVGIMDTPDSALLHHSFYYKNPSASLRSNSGIWISRDWILTHGTALSSIINKYHAISSFVENMPSGKLTMVPQELTNELKFQVYRDSGIDDASKSNSKYRVQQHSGFVAAAWKCRLLGKTFDEFFETWSFPKSSVECDQLLRSIFLLIRVFDHNKPFVEISMAEQALSRLLDQLQDPVRGTSAEIMSTPFGNPVFINSIARGIISNVVGEEDCVIMTDALAFPGGEGGPVCIISSDCNRRDVSGMVIAPLSWCRGEQVDYTLAANLAPCLLDILQKRDVRVSNRTYHKETLDRGIVLVRCGISWGTGILVDKDTGIFLTCSHVVEEAPGREISIVTRADKSISRVPAKLLYKTPDCQPYDVAILQVNPEDMDPSLKVIRLSHDPVLEGEPVVSIGFPFFTSIRPTVSSGVVSKTTDWAILTTCCTHSGISGGPIVSQATGEMLGMIVCNAHSSDGTMHYSRMSLAVPATVLNGPLQEYLRTGNPEVFRAFTCNDAVAHKIWNFQLLLPSKL
ncbi:peroxisomal leader peptide-processing protease isoform X1 [Ooceraea biroi]|nr:peroxisomal leader peptide-processing protease isoform X1 [Ooceraea biroi]